jgi:hypothetical protein
MRAAGFYAPRRRGKPLRLTLDALLAGTPDVPWYFKRARQRWEEILGSGQIDVPLLAERLKDEQRFFEQECGGRYLGQEIMAWSALAYLFSAKEDSSPGQLARARALVEAFTRSSCSWDAKTPMIQAAEFYGLNDPARGAPKVH